MNPRTSAGAAPAVRPATPGIRLAAAVLDGAAIILIGLLLARPISAIEDALGLIRFLSIDTTAEALMALLLPIWGAAWVVFLAEAAFAATPGKLALGLRIARRDGTKAPIGARLGRCAAKSAGLLIFPPFGLVDALLPAVILLAVGLAAVLGSPLALVGRRQALHDLVSETAVFRRADLGRAPTGREFRPPSRGREPAAPRQGETR